jgi:uncharacterized membrane protein
MFWLGILLMAPLVIIGVILVGALLLTILAEEPAVFFLCAAILCFFIGYGMVKEASQTPAAQPVQVEAPR